jgi:probable phosphoglycerate mutase
MHMGNGSASRGELWLIRHGETEWTRSGAHTSYTDLPLTAAGEFHAGQLKRLLAARQFALVLSSPMRRALETCRLAGYEDVAQVSTDLAEWNYGSYEGRTTVDIQKEAPGWTIWTATPPGGEEIEQVAARADHVIQRAVSAGGDVAMFGHGHMMRVLGARWLGVAPDFGKYLALATSSISVLGYERETRVIRMWGRESE